MYIVRNTSDVTRRFNARAPDGQLFIARLAPNESGEFDLDVRQAVFVRGHLKARKAPAARRKTKPASST